MPDLPDEDRDTHPRTEAFVPDFSDSDDDTGAQPIAQSDTEEPGPPAEEPSAPEEGAEPEAPATPAPPVTVPGRYQYLKWWKLVLVILGVWVVTGEVGLSLFYWWYHTIDKTLPVFMVLVYVVACVVGGVLLAMVQGRPLISALSIAVMSGPFASVAAAAPLYGYYYCERVGHCLIGVIPY